MPRAKRRRGRAAGEGSIRRREITRKDGTKYKRYNAVITLGWIGGKQKQLEGPRRTTEQEALADLRQLRREFESGNLGSLNNPTVGEFLDFWLEQKVALARSSQKNYRADVEHYIKPALGHLRLNKLKAVAIQKWQTDLLNARGPFVARKARAALSSALTQALRWQLVSQKLMDAVPPVKLPEEKRRRWTLAEVKRFLKVAEGHPFHTLFLLTLNTGLRIGEVRGLRWRDIEGDVLHVRQQVQGYGRNAPFTPLKTKGSRRDLPLPPDIQAALQRHREAQAEMRRSAGRFWVEHDLVFPTRLGTPLGPDRIYDALNEIITKTVREDINTILETLIVKAVWMSRAELDALSDTLERGNEEAIRRAAAQFVEKAAQHMELDTFSLQSKIAQAGVRRIRFHDLRHTNASLLIRKTDAKTVSARLGHADSSITHRIYIHEFEDQFKRFAPSMTDLLED